MLTIQSTFWLYLKFDVLCSSLQSCLFFIANFDEKFCYVFFSRRYWCGKIDLVTYFIILRCFFKLPNDGRSKRIAPIRCDVKITASHKTENSWKFLFVYHFFNNAAKSGILKQDWWPLCKITLLDARNMQQFIASFKHLIV